MTRILILYNEPILPETHADRESEREILWTVDGVREHLVGAGYDVVSLGIARDPALLLLGLRERQPDVVFNLFEGLPDAHDPGPYPAGFPHWLGVPFPGCPFHPLTIPKNKALTKHLPRGPGFSTADAFVVDRLPVPPCPLP